MMTTTQVADWLRAHGVAESVITDEAAYIAATYADPDEDPLAVLHASLPSYLQRTRSGVDYSTDLPDPFIAPLPYVPAPRPYDDGLTLPPPILPTSGPTTARLGGISMPMVASLAAIGYAIYSSMKGRG